MIANSTTKKALSRCLLFCAVLLGFSGMQTVQASHFGAGDLSVTYIGTGQGNYKYAIVLQTYVTCEAGQASLYTSETINWTSSCGGGGSHTIQIKKNQWNTNGGDTLDQLCANYSAQNSCRYPNSIYPGSVRGTFLDTVTLPFACNDWTFSWCDGSRGTIVNLQNSTSQSIYVEAKLDNTGTHWGNSTPRFLVPPIPYLCVNQDDIFVNGPYDPDIDSLVTVNFQANTCGGTGGIPIPFAGGGYALTNPFNSPINYFGYTSPYVINPITGTSYFHPTNTGKYVIAFRCYDYDKYTGALIGYTSRDVQVSILSCNTTPPAIDTTIGTLVGGLWTSSTTITVCPGVPMTFQVHANSQAATNNVFITANNAITAPGSTFTQSGVGTGNVTGTFSWTPGVGDVGPHVVLFIAKDSTCSSAQPIVLTNYLIVTINVLPGIDAGPDGHFCNDEGPNNQPWQLNVVGPPGIGYTWSAISGNTTPPYGLSCLNCPNPLASPTTTTTYVVNTNAPQATCKNKDTVVVFVGPEPGNSVDAIAALPLVNGVYILCRPGYVNLDAVTTGPPPPVSLPCGPVNTINCTSPDSVTVGTNPIATPTAQANTPYYSYYRYQKYQFIIPKAELIASGLLTGTLKSLSFFSSSATPLGPNALANFTISLKCTNKTSFPATATDADFEQGLTQVYIKPTFINTPNAWDKFVFQQPYNWDSSQNLLVEICQGQMIPTFNTNGFTPVNVVPGTAIQRYSNTSNVCAANGTGVNSYVQRPQVKFDYCAAPAPQFVFKWTPGQNLSDSSIKSPIAYIPHNTQYVVSTLARNGCVMRDSLQIVVPVHHVDIYPKDTAICVGQSVRLFATGATSYQWFEDGFTTPTTLSCNTCSSTTATPKDTGDITYTVVFTDDVACNDTASVTIHAWPLPNVHITNADTTIKYGQHVNLMVTDANSGHGASYYTWTPVGSLSDPNIPNPVASPTQNTTYILFGDDTHHCRNMDTVNINIDYRDHLMVPSAFTPNGDLKNDRFRVANLTFQKIMEFRVFNRWGQEVFSARDNDGWDGTWKGVPQDLGAYQFIIRVGFPDGFVETYKGDVTLVR